MHGSSISYMEELENLRFTHVKVVKKTCFSLSCIKATYLIPKALKSPFWAFGVFGHDILVPILF